MEKRELELRNSKIEEMENIIKVAKEEKRALTEDELGKINNLKEEVRAIDETAKAEKEVRELNNNNKEVKGEIREMENTKMETRELEMRAFEELCRNFESRDMSKGANGVIIPQTIANQIIEMVEEKSSIYSRAKIINAGGKVSFPIHTKGVQCAYQGAAFQAISATSGSFDAVELDSYVAGALAKVDKALANDTEFDIVAFVMNEVATAVAEFIDHELLEGNTKMKGLVTTTNEVNNATPGKLTADDLIDLEMSIPTQFAKDAVFVMTKEDLKKVRKLKDADGNYMLNRSLTEGFGYDLLGHPVLVNDDATAIYFANMSGLYVKVAKNVEIQVLQEKYADQHAVGFVAWVQADSAIVETQKVAKLVVA